MITKIHIQGILSKYFGGSFNVNICNSFLALKAIDASRDGFIKKIFDLSAMGYDYCMIVDGEFVNDINKFIEKRNIKRIDIVPSINGSGGAIVGAIAGAAFAATTAGVIATFLVNAAITAAVSLGTSYLAAMMNKQASPPQQSIAVGGATAMLEAKGKSYIFANYENSANQGDSIPVGYGKMKVASKVILFGIKEFPTNITTTDEFTKNEAYSVFSNYLAS